MKVLKFGGTSVGTVESLLNVKRIVESNSEPEIVVVSALGGLTDQLIATAKACEKGECNVEESVGAFRKRHHDIIETLVDDAKKQAVVEKIDSLLKELSNVYLGVSLLNELSERTLNRIVSFGERMSSVIVAAIIEGAEHRDSLEFMRTECWMGKNIADRQLTDSGIKATFHLPLAKRYVVGGFISRDRENGDITNLGRGGSDYTAALIAAALDADLLEIWTDVDGFMTADPRIVPDARVIPHMSFVESMELCSFGAKVIYPPTIYPVFHKNIPIKILNTHKPEVPGTFISDNVKDLPRCVRGVSLMRHTGMACVKGHLANGMGDVKNRTRNALARAGISVLLVAEPNDEETVSVSLAEAETAKALNVLSEEFAPEIGNGEISSITVTADQAVLAVVREGIKKMEGLGPRLNNSLRRGGIEVNGVSDGASDAAVAFVVDDDKAVEALRLIHDAVTM